MDTSAELTGEIAEALRAPAGPISEQLEPREASCPEHGPYTSTGTKFTTGKRREFWSPCPGCSAQRAKDEAEKEQEDRREREANRVRELLGLAAIPARFIGRDFAGYKAETPAQQKALRVASEYAEKFSEHLKTGESLLFIGDRGTGKSHLATAILQAILPRGHRGLYMTVADLIGAVRETWRRDSPRSQADVIRELCRVPLLVLDEVGVQSGTDNEQSIIFQVVDQRYREKQPMILLANCTPAQVKDLLGDRTADRLREIATAVVFDWESYRAKARKQ